MPVWAGKRGELTDNTTWLALGHSRRCREGRWDVRPGSLQDGVPTTRLLGQWMSKATFLVAEAFFQNVSGWGTSSQSVECSPRRRALLLEVSIDDWKSSYTGPRMSLTVVISERVKAVGSTGEEKDTEKYAGAQSRPCQRQFSCRTSQV
ncbi:hypothetical protein NEUTE1DRAFT_98703 [Neurospora tetrasperma FGSC 2508]|uniref:Uncharacterized protein n=1 Tax=Neurospora tetrasperma (strain FGSC 2508 / ATCC MYA-4615 / P0657) TaxID=510951 RepID=F8MED9_NEUT8|nr:uncharacterized protein NEUTE1DRAFT_98703 [Neurospora tetrasperma FGSC 2508]EGO61621.1 hypothetical protein NEUTE1DRAFT_98703 [Neurospora tetrasperma FGSC 2508]